MDQRSVDRRADGGCGCSSCMEQNGLKKVMTAQSNRTAGSRSDRGE